jgi:hypothetical protein
MYLKRDTVKIFFANICRSLGGKGLVTNVKQTSYIFAFSDRIKVIGCVGEATNP